MGVKMFCVTVAQLWNSLSLDLRWQASASLFRRKFEKLLLDEQKSLAHFCPLFDIEYLYKCYLF